MKGMLVGVLGGMLLVGCGKKEVPPPLVEAESPAGPAGNVTPTATPEMDALVQAALADLQAKLQAQNYDAAVGSLVTLKDMPRSPEAEAAYQRQLQQTVNTLSARAAAGDAAAQQSQRALGTFMTGR